MANKKLLAALAVLLVIPVVMAEPQLVITVDPVVDNPFEITVGITETIEEFRGLNFEIISDSSDITLVDANKLGGSDLSAHHHDNNVALVATKPVNLSSNILLLKFETTGEPGEEFYIRLEDGEYAIESGDNVYTLQNSLSEQVKLSPCISYPNTHVYNDGAPKLPGTACYCNPGYLPTVDTLSGWTCEYQTDNIYGEHSQDCSLGGAPIYDTGYCCEAGYYVNPVLTADNFAEMFGEGVEVCVVKPNAPPSPQIDSPDHNDEYKVNKRIRFSAKGTTDPEDGEDDECASCKYEWDLGDRSRPWGRLTLDSDEDIICEQVSGSKECDEDDADVIGDIDDEDPDNPCVCTKYEDHVYERETGKTAYHTYKSKYACTEYDDDETDECEIVLYVTDSQGATSKTSIDIELEGGSSFDDDDDGVAPRCGDGDVDVYEDCDGNPSAYCESGICNSDCTCYEFEDIPIIEEPRPEPVCGNQICESGERPSCMIDCHCGDGICQEEYNEKGNCSDCEDEGGSFWAVALISIIIVGGLLFALKQGYISLDKLLPGLATHGMGNSPEFNLERMAEQHNVHQPRVGGTASLQNYIKSTRAKGYSYSQIRGTLLKKGWSEDQVNSVFSKLNP